MKDNYEGNHIPWDMFCKFNNDSGELQKTACVHRSSVATFGILSYKIHTFLGKKTNLPLCFA